MRILKTTLFTTFLAANAWAGDKEISLDTGLIGSTSDAWRVVGGNPMPTIGLSGGWDVAPGLTAVGTLQWGQSGSKNYFGNQWWEEDEGGSASPGSEGFIAAIHLIQLQGGVRSDLMQNRWVRPYGVAKLSTTVGVLRLDDDPSDKDNVNQIQSVGFSIGGIAAAGIAVERPRKQAGPFAFRCELEAGYGFGTALGFDEIGELEMSAMHIRAAAGVRF
jgi:hypothetical protein